MASRKKTRKARKNRTARKTRTRKASRKHARTPAAPAACELPPPALPAARSPAPWKAPPRPGPVRHHAKIPQPGPASIPKIFEALAAILVPYARMFESEMHPRMGYCLKAKHGERQAQELYFGSVELHPDHVSYHLFLLYSYPDLEARISPQLRALQREKTSFEFEHADAALFAELETLTRACFERFRSEGLYAGSAGGSDPDEGLVI